MSTKGGPPADDLDELADTLAAETPPPDVVPPPVPAGDLVAGRFRILGVVGMGAMGTVYRVRDEELDEIIALKMLRASLVAAPIMLERFRREVKLARRVTHANVARTFDIGEHGAQKFITMELIDGESIADILAREGALAPSRVVALVEAICAGLTAAHGAGVVHRDLKPENVLVSRKGRVVVTDFGVAAARGGDEVPTIPGLTGTPAYMAPEQVMGARVDARADVYAVGAILFELLTDRLPFEARTALEAAVARLKEPPPNVCTLRPEVPAALGEVIARAMARSPGDRFQTVEELSRALVAAVPAASPMMLSSGERGTAPKTIAVLPFRGKDGEDEAAATAFADDLVDCLSMARGLRVRPSAAVRTALAAEPAAGDARAAGKQLDVQLVVHGTVQRAGDRLRVHARLTSVEDGFQVWAQRIERPLAESFVAADEMARALASALSAPTLLPSALAADSGLADLYRRGRHAYQKLGPETSLEAVALLEEACRQAPEDPVLLSAYAMALVRAWNFNLGEGNLDARAAAACARAITYAPHRAEPYLARALLERLRGDWVAAGRALGEAFVRDPDLGEAHEMLGLALLEVGEELLGEVHLRRAHALDPGLHQGFVYLARARALQGDFPRAYAVLEELATRGAGLPYATTRARIILWQGDAAAAEAALAEPGDPRSDFVMRWLLASFLGRPVSGTDLALLAQVKSSGAPRRRCFFHQLTAELAALSGQIDQALAELEITVDLGLIDRLWLDRCPAFDGLRGHPKFVAMRVPVEERATALLKLVEPLLAGPLSGAKTEDEPES